MRAPDTAVPGYVPCERRPRTRKVPAFRTPTTDAALAVRGVCESRIRSNTAPVCPVREDREPAGESVHSAEILRRDLTSATVANVARGT
ncbi:hypothetical protein GCM10009608_31030 [Pseudonocardia alaniniphila]